jgi:hypothetical protein
VLVRSLREADGGDNGCHPTIAFVAERSCIIEFVLALRLTGNLARPFECPRRVLSG